MTEILKVSLLNAELALNKIDKQNEKSIETRLQERRKRARGKMIGMVKDSKEWVYPENVATKVSQAIADPITSNFAVDEEGNILGQCFY